MFQHQRAFQIKRSSEMCLPSLCIISLLSFSKLWLVVSPLLPGDDTSNINPETLPQWTSLHPDLWVTRMDLLQSIYLYLIRNQLQGGSTAAPWSLISHSFSYWIFLFNAAPEFSLLLYHHRVTGKREEGSFTPTCQLTWVKSNLFSSQTVDESVRGDFSSVCAYTVRVWGNKSI